MIFVELNFMKPTIIVWKEPNRAQTPPLHIASRGERYSTLTGAWWIDEYRIAVNHRSGLRIAIFDIRDASKPIVIAEIPHLSDDIAAKFITENYWEISVSGCWEEAYSVYKLVMKSEPEMSLQYTKHHKDRTFSHGVAYGKNGELCVAFHTGNNPRIEISDKAWKLPEPWGARDVCYDYENDKYYAIAVSHNPQKSSYQNTSTSVWTYEADIDDWKIASKISGVHSDACQVYRGRLWIPDQKGDRVFGLDLSQKSHPITLSGKCFNFPHGLAISDFGMLAVTNYGNSSITLMDISNL